MWLLRAVRLVNQQPSQRSIFLLVIWKVWPRKPLTSSHAVKIIITPPLEKRTELTIRRTARYFSRHSYFPCSHLFVLRTSRPPFCFSPCIFNSQQSRCAPPYSPQVTRTINLRQYSGICWSFPGISSHHGYYHKNARAFAPPVLSIFFLIYSSWHWLAYVACLTISVRYSF